MKRKLFLLSALFLLFGGYQNSFAQSKRYYVDINAKGKKDGTSWKDAFDYFGHALNIAAYGDEVWVAKGKYTPAAGFPFEINKSIKVYGGFNGGETELSQRDLINSRAILEQDKKEDFLYHSNLLRVTNTDTTAVLDGFILQKGYAYIYESDIFGEIEITCNNNPYYLRACHGGAIYMESETITKPAFLNIKNCIFRNNTANNGGAISMIYSNTGEGGLNIDNCEFYDNYSFYGGSCIFLSGVGNFVNRINNCIFRNNHSDGNSGAVTYLNYNGPSNKFILENSIFSNNYAEGYAALETVSYSKENIDILNCIFKNNQTVAFSGINARLTNCRFTENVGYLGAVHSYSCTFLNCIFDKNAAMNSKGGAIYFGNSTQNNVINSVFFNNKSAQEGAAIYIDNSEVNIHNSIFSENKSFLSADNIYVKKGIKSNLNITNSLFNVVSFDSIVIDDIIGIPAYTLDTGTILIDSPYFWDTALGDYRLGFCSPAIDKGRILYTIKYGITKDFNSESRIKGLNPDMGAFEMDYFSYDKTITNSLKNNPNGEIKLENFKGVKPPLVFNWSNGSPDSVNSNLYPGNYTLYFEDNTGCQDSFYFKIESSTLTTSISGLSNITVSPNPTNASNNSTLTMNSSISQTLELTIINSSGQILNSNSWNVNTGNNTYELQTFSPGIYYVKLVNKVGESASFKYVVY